MNKGGKIRKKNRQKFIKMSDLAAAYKKMKVQVSVVIRTSPRCRYGLRSVCSSLANTTGSSCSSFSIRLVTKYFRLNVFEIKSLIFGHHLSPHHVKSLSSLFCPFFFESIGGVGGRGGRDVRKYLRRNIVYAFVNQATSATPSIS